MVVKEQEDMDHSRHKRIRMSQRVSQGQEVQGKQGSMTEREETAEIEVSHKAVDSMTKTTRVTRVRVKRAESTIDTEVVEEATIEVVVERGTTGEVIQGESTNLL